MKIRNKISIIFVIATATLMLLLSVFVYLLSVHNTSRVFYTRLRVRASLAAESYAEQNAPHGYRVEELRNRHLQRLPSEKDYFIIIDRASGTWHRDTALALPDNFYRTALTQGYAEYNENFRYYVALIPPKGPGNFMVVAAAVDETGQTYVQNLLHLLLAGLALAVIIVFFLSRLFARQVIKPVSDITARVNHISASNLHNRLDAGNGKDELSQLAKTFNDMLDRLETAFEIQSNFISNASHELRTPLTSILGEAEIILSQPRTAAEYEASIQVMQQEARKLDDLTASLLRLSQVAYDGQKQSIEEVGLEEILLQAKSDIDKRMPGNRVRIMVQDVPDTPDAFRLVCSRVWMELALINILSNSVKYSDNKEVLATLSATNDDIYIHISDSGIGIPEDELKHVFEPFFRASNTHRYKGYGIGLPLTEKIIRLHGGKILIHSKPQVGTKVSLRFRRQHTLKSSEKKF